MKDTLSLKDTSTVDGDINVRRFQVELDAKFNGNCHMITEDEFDKIVSDMIPGEGKAGKAQTPGTQVKL